MARETFESNDGSYLSVPAMDTHRRRLFTFTHPILLSHDGSVVATAAEGIEDDTPANGMRFLVLDAVWDGRFMWRIQLDGQDAIIGVWVNAALIASEQVQAASLSKHATRNKNAKAK